jgi:hypothetical protein
MLKPLTVVHVPKHNLIVFESLPPSVTPEDALLLARQIYQAGVNARQGAKGEQSYPQEAL